ncbi:hypothetical protein LSAT2_005314 [Lamellibrachia satsuma]|nr:hypothetical protein LSAT2_005314 [Lamellibrachia satsuma]
MWGTRVIIPSAHRQALLEELHNAHSGIVRMKAVGRSLMWWPGIDQDLEKTAKTCDICMRSRPRPKEAPLQPWSFPDRPWSPLHIDYAGPFMGRMMLVSFSTDVIVSDNATGFVSEEFQDFCRHNGIKHITSAPHHPASNGLAERAVGIVKEGVKRMHGGDLETKLARFLFDYRITPHSTTGIAPAELLMHRQLKTRLHLIRPDVGVKVVAEQTKQKAKHDRHAKVRTFLPDELVYALRYHGNTATWVPGTIHRQTGPVSYTARLEDGTIARHYSDQLQGILSSNQVTPSVRPTPLETFPEDVTEFCEKSEADQQAQLRSLAKPPAASQQTDTVPAAASVDVLHVSVNTLNVWICRTEEAVLTHHSLILVKCAAITMDEENVLPPTTMMAATTVTIWGDRRKALDKLTKREWAFLGVSVVGILLTIALTIYRLVVVVRSDPAHPDFTIAILILASAVFCLWYAIHGLLYERMYELYLLVAAISLVVLYCIVDYIGNVQGRTRVKLVRLVLACVMAFVNIPLAILVANTFSCLIFVTVGASQLYQSMYMELARFLHLQKFDIQVAVSIVILRMRDGTSLDTIEIITLVLGVTVSVVWYVIGSYSVQRERKWWTFVFAMMCLLEPAYITYRLVVVSVITHTNNNELCIHACI